MGIGHCVSQTLVPVSVEKVMLAVEPDRIFGHQAAAVVEIGLQVERRSGFWRIIGRVRVNFEPLYAGCVPLANEQPACGANRGGLLVILRQRRRC